MSNDLAIRPTGTALSTNVSPYREAVNEEIGADFGTFLKFTKGDWTLGEKGKEVPPDARFVVNMEEAGGPAGGMAGRLIISSVVSLIVIAFTRATLAM